MENWERDILRALAHKKVELANLPIMQKRADAWTAHNDLKSDIPMIHFETNSIIDEGFHRTLKCESEEARKIEWNLALTMLNYDRIGDDRVVDEDYICLFHSSFEPFSMPIKKINKGGVGFHIEPQINDLSDISALKHSKMSFDMEASKKEFEITQDAIGDILKVRMGMKSLYACLTNDIVHRMGMENMFFAMYDTPDEFKIMLDMLSDDYVTYFKELEKRGMICANNGNDWLHQGSFGFTDDLPGVADKTTDCWGFMDSQETVGVDPDMFHEFFFPYYKKVTECFGLLSYGCCEPVHSFWEKSLSKFENLRKISISPWCDQEYMADKLKDRKVIFLRKPSPNFIGIEPEFDEAGFRAHIKETLKAAEGCCIEFSFRDVYSLGGDFDKPRRAVEIVREEIANR